MTDKLINEIAELKRFGWRPGTLAGTVSRDHANGKVETVPIMDALKRERAAKAFFDSIPVVKPFAGM